MDKELIDLYDRYLSAEAEIKSLEEERDLLYRQLLLRDTFIKEVKEMIDNLKDDLGYKN